MLEAVCCADRGFAHRTRMALTQPLEQTVLVVSMHVARREHNNFFIIFHLVQAETRAIRVLGLFAEVAAGCELCRAQSSEDFRVSGLESAAEDVVVALAVALLHEFELFFRPHRRDLLLVLLLLLLPASTQSNQHNTADCTH